MSLYDYYKRSHLSKSKDSISNEPIYFNDMQKDILIECSRTVNEIYYETRKGVPQCKMIICVDTTALIWSECAEDFIPVPEGLVGHWATTEAYDLSDVTVERAINDFRWERVERKEIVMTTWVRTSDLKQIN
ncbi:hypothetical protein VCHA53O466_40371 [Vibrio chagasii]|nr:hypothetical protein VCHA53O466_40371 [Vibrio chagasii]